MAKQAKEVDTAEITPRIVNAMIKDVLEGFANIDSAKGKYMSAAKRQRELIGAVYERAAQKGIPQVVAKLQVEIERLQMKLAGKITDLEIENRKLLQRVIKARGNKTQLALFADLPAMPKPTKAEREAEAKAEKEFPGVTGEELTGAAAVGSA
jgi:hypothetical protein